MASPVSVEWPYACAPLAEVVAARASADDALAARIRTALEPFRKAGLTGDLTVQFREAQNGDVKIASVTLSSRAAMR